MANPRTLDNTHPALRRAFHPVCRSTDVGDSAVIRVTLLDEDWAVARTDDGLMAVPDACPHRSSPLSAGGVIGSTIQCAYHGYRFGHDGRCVEIPALGPGSAIPPKAHVVAAHSVIERYGLIWLAPERPLTPVIDVPEWEDPAFVIVPLPDQTWKAGAGQMVDNFLDLAHFPFTHPSSFGDPDDIVVPPYSVERDGFTFSCDYVHSSKRISDSMPPERRAATADSYDVAPRTSRWRFAAPFAIRLRIEYPADDMVLTIVFFHQPVDAETTKLYCFDLRNDILDGRATVDETRAFQMVVAAEDRVLLERIRTKSTPLDPQSEVHTRADRITLEFRRVLADFVEAADAANTDGANPDMTNPGSTNTDARVQDPSW
jgi:phenylpropionate dioxygenase-like ring-hydroxylating dioxygenase large terminal subunit